MEGQVFEKFYVECALNLAKERGMTQMEFAKKVWPNKSEASANTTIIALKSQNSRGKPQNLRVSDAIAMAEILGKEFPSFAFEVWEKLKISANSLTTATFPPSSESVRFPKKDPCKA